MADFVGDRKKKFMEHRAPPWQPGQSGNPKGRALGSRNRMSESFLEDLRATWEKHGAPALETCAGSCPVAWCSWRWETAFTGKSRAGQLAIAGRLTVGSSLNGAMVSSVM